MDNPEAATAVPEECRPFFDGLRQGQLRFPRCGRCARFHWYPMRFCPYCRNATIAWTPVGGPATVFTWTEVRHAFEPAFSDRLPYVVALVEFDDAPGVRLVTNLEGCSREQLRIGLRVFPRFPRAEEEARVTFGPAR